MKPPLVDPLHPRIQALTERERAVLRLLLAGHDAKSAARALGLSVHTINERLRDARRKLGASSSREAARLLAEAEPDAPQFSGDKHFGVAAHGGREATGGQADGARGVDHRLIWLGGGMLIMSLIVATAVLLPTVQGVGTTRAEPTPETALTAAASGEIAAEAEAAAREWIALVDAGRWTESWRAASTPFRSQLTAPQWTAAVQPIRQPLGPVTSRVVQSATRTASLPGAPAGDYVVILFRTRFTHRPDATETVVLTRDASEWKVAGYFIR